MSARHRLIAATALTLSALGFTLALGPSAGTMANAANAFLESLTPEQRQRATFAFDSSERTHWHFVPVEAFARNGLTIKDMTAKQRELAHALLKAGLSQRGYMTATQIMELENILGAMEAARRAAAAQPSRTAPIERDPLKYFFSIFGTPSARGTWGWRAEGHHVSLQFTIVNGSLVSSTPSFFGVNPAEVREPGPKQGTRILAAEEDAARALVEALDESQRKVAILDTVAPNDIVTMANVKVDPLAPVGIAFTALNASQRTLLRKLIDVYANQMATDIAADRITRIEKGGWDRVTFAWAGTLARGARHYYRVQGPSFLIEYDNTQNNANHIHSVWRDFAGDFGVDLLREHVRGLPHN
ncbi:MAG TPA: DUF3500 domain-containing protein [Gemmatimonadaceae bacterium]|nr:DUF3500 domain-containing protein [Gemmatimonadaceae bacterium]